MLSQSLRRFVGTALTTLALATAACGGDATGPEPAPGPAPADVSGSYALTQVRTLGNLGGGGNGLPVTFIDGQGDALTFTSGTLVLGADGTFDLSVESTFKGSPVTLTDFGTYSVVGGTIDFDSDRSTPRLSTATVSGSQITAQCQFGSIPFEIDLQK